MEIVPVRYGVREQVNYFYNSISDRVKAKGLELFFDIELSHRFFLLIYKLCITAPESNCSFNIVNDIGICADRMQQFHNGTGRISHQWYCTGENRTDKSGV